jgi:glycine cleavage system H protein
MNIPTSLRYHVVARVGAAPRRRHRVDRDHRSRAGALGDLVYLELPEVGRKLAAAEACAVVESVKRPPTSTRRSRARSSPSTRR